MPSPDEPLPELPPELKAALRDHFGPNFGKTGLRDPEPAVAANDPALYLTDDRTAGIRDETEQPEERPEPTAPPISEPGPTPAPVDEPQLTADQETQVRELMAQAFPDRSDVPGLTLSPAGEGEDRGDAPGPAEGQLEPEFFDRLAASLAKEQPPVDPRFATPPAAEQQPAQPQRINIPAPLLIALVEHGLAGQEEFMARLGVGLGAIIDFHINRAVLLIAGIDSPVARGQIVENLVRNLPKEVDNAFLRLHQTPGGIVVPPKGMELPPAPGAN